MFKNNNRPETDLNMKFRFYDFGLSFRICIEQPGSPNFLSLLFGLKKNNLYFGCFHQIKLNEISNYSIDKPVVTLGVDLFQALSNYRCT